MDVKRPGDLIYVLGITLQELGGSEYFGLNGCTGNDVPRVNSEMAKEIYRRLHEQMKMGIIASCHDCSDGGLGVSLAEMAFAGDLGMDIDLRKVPRRECKRNDFVLFSESQSRFVVTVHPENRTPFEESFRGVPFGQIGVVIKERRFKAVGLDGERVIDCSIDELRKAWKRPLEEIK